MDQPISSAGRVCHCEWTKTVTATMVFALLSQLKRQNSANQTPLLLMLNLHPASLASLAHHANPFFVVIPALLDCCCEIVIAADGDSATLNTLRRHLLRSSPSPTPAIARSIRVFPTVQEAFTHAQSVFPHDVIELRRKNL
jgi:hypothetical protein